MSDCEQCFEAMFTTQKCCIKVYIC